ncbi:MAG: UDP-3-O-(3-hydroxymyristoyl)glucosamine N-acyltransferase [Elusimicrobiota bacterium]
MSLRMTLKELAERTGCVLEGDPAHEVGAAAGLAEAGPSDVSFLENPKYAEQVAVTKAGAVFLHDSAKGKPGPANRLYCAQPKWAYAQWLALIDKERRRTEPPLVSPKADVHREAVLGKDVFVGPFATIGARTIIGERSSIGAHCAIGYNVRIGKDCVVHPNVVIYDFCELKDRVELHSGTVVGSDGYGYWTDPKTGEHRKIPQIGRVVLEDDVEVGSNVSLDRATTGETRIGAGTKIDNLVQVGHNVRMGRSCLIVSQAGIAGSTALGNGVVLAGQAGVAGHLTIGDGVVVTAQTGVMNDVEPKTILFGSPARPHREAMKLQAIFSKLPEMYQAFKELRRKAEEAPR